MPKKPNYFYLGIPLVLAVYVLAYFPFASTLAGSRSRLGVILALLGMLVFVLLGRWLFPPRTKLGRVVLWLFYISWAACFLGTVAVSIPQEGHLTIGGFVIILVFALQGLLIPLTLLLLLIDLPQGKNAGFTAVGLGYLIVASYFFSGIQYSVPMILDSWTGSKFFSRESRRLNPRPANYGDIAADPKLLERKRVLDGQYQYELDTAAMRGGPEMKAKVLETIEKGLPDIKDLEYQQRALLMLVEIHPNLQLDASCPHDLVPFLLKVMEQKKAAQRDFALSDTACIRLMIGLKPLISSNTHPDLAQRLENYLLERQLHPPASTRLPDGSYMYETVNAVSEIITIIRMLETVQNPSVEDRRAARSLALFIPYLKARHENDIATRIQALAN